MPLVTQAGASTIPACLDALIAAATAVFGAESPDVQVVDGQPVGDIADDVMCIGTTGRPGEVAVQESLTAPHMATAPDAESYDVACVASAWRGAEVDPKAVRDRVFEMVRMLARELARDPTLGGVVTYSRLSVVTFFQEQTGGAEDPEAPTGVGAVATVQFTVHVEAFTGQV